MKNKQKIFLLTLSLCIMLTAVAYADGAPASQFGFSGWPYRQQTGCDPAAQDTADCPATPSPTPVITQKPTPVITQRPTNSPVITPAPTETPAETAEPIITPTAVPTAIPTTQAPTATPTAIATAIPTAAPTATKVPEPTQKPIETEVPPSTDDDYTTGSITAQEENAFLLLNADRAANGRSALSLDPVLCSLARLKSCDMNANNYFAHTSPTLGSAADMLRSHGYSFNSVGENIAHHATVEKSQAAFMSSTGHRTNILGTQWTKVGIGVCVDKQGFVYVTQLFVR